MACCLSSLCRPLRNSSFKAQKKAMTVTVIGNNGGVRGYSNPSGTSTGMTSIIALTMSEGGKNPKFIYTARSCACVCALAEDSKPLLFQPTHT